MSEVKSTPLTRRYDDEYRPVKSSSDRLLVNIVTACAMVCRSRRTLYRWLESGSVDYVCLPSGQKLIYADSLFRQPERA